MLSKIIQWESRLGMMWLNGALPDRVLQQTFARLQKSDQYQIIAGVPRIILRPEQLNDVAAAKLLWTAAECLRRQVVSDRMDRFIKAHGEVHSAAVDHIDRVKQVVDDNADLLQTEDWNRIQRMLEKGSACMVRDCLLGFDIDFKLCPCADPQTWYAETLGNYRKLEAALNRVERFVTARVQDHREAEYDSYEVRPKGKYAGKLWT